MSRRDRAKRQRQQVSAQVFGEDPAVLSQAFRILVDESTRLADGSVSISACLSPELGGPFARALLRAEAELLLTAADAFDASPTGRSRSFDQAALLLVLNRTTQAWAPQDSAD